MFGIIFVLFIVSVQHFGQRQLFLNGLYKYIEFYNYAHFVLFGRTNVPTVLTKQPHELVNKKLVFRVLSS